MFRGAVGSVHSLADDNVSKSSLMSIDQNWNSCKKLRILFLFCLVLTDRPKWPVRPGAKKASRTSLTASDRGQSSLEVNLKTFFVFTFNFSIKTLSWNSSIWGIYFFRLFCRPNVNGRRTWEPNSNRQISRPSYTFKPPKGHTKFNRGL